MLMASGTKITLFANDSYFTLSTSTATSSPKPTTNKVRKISQRTLFLSDESASGLPKNQKKLLSPTKFLPAGSWKLRRIVPIIG